MPRPERSLLPWSECLCPICREILQEPVTLPCGHTLCSPCFQMTVEKASLCCPFCRRRVSSWARHRARTRTLVNSELWETIQRQYPDECQRRASGQETEELDDGFVVYPAPQLCKPGEIRQEYEAEISKIEAERLAQEEAERKASEEYIQKLLAVEEEQQRLAEAKRREMEEQLRRDEELARTLSSVLNVPSASPGLSSPRRSPTVPKQAASAKSCRAAKSKPSQSGDIERFLCPKPQQDLAALGSDDLSSPDTLDGSISMENEMHSDEDDDDEMPILTPQAPFRILHSLAQESDLELSIPGLSQQNNTIHDGALPCPAEGDGSARNRRAVRGKPHRVLEDFSSPRSSSSQQSHWAQSVCGCSAMNGNTTEQQDGKVTPKRKCEEHSSDSEVVLEAFSSGKRRRLPSANTYTGSGFHAEQLMELEKDHYERRRQEEQDRLLALQLQREMDKEQKQVSRKKGSPDEYQLRPKSTSGLQESTLPKRTESKPSSAQTKRERLQGGGTPNENKKPNPKNQARSPRGVRQVRGGVVAEGSCSPNGVKVLRPSNKQQTILDMFQRPVGK
ncbi:E3 ubiquitin-protein ligase RNF168 [Ascaphus truei]|uniref:E3 ubiquitin-protein ligase RNF168 n=1 Tax=Ascaphus truei TaxID=8439 RepID=UPI003F5A39EE